MTSAKPIKRRINGVLLLDKPRGISSNTALQQAKRLYAAEKAGHTGVLDPLATGLLPICFGEATKFAQYLIDADKAYTATLKLGEATTTGDAEGEVIDTADINFQSTDFKKACELYTGEIQQVPPMFSALKHEGKPLYEYARKGITIERKARQIHIYKIEVNRFELPEAEIHVQCSKGTYIRTLSEDIARSLHTYAHLIALRRTQTAGFDIDNSHTLEYLATLNESQRDALLLPCDVLVQHLPSLILPETIIAELCFGRRPKWQYEGIAGQPIRIYHAEGRFIGLAEYQEEGCLKAVRLMNTSQ